MKRLRAVGAFTYDFVIGDDWRMAAGVVVALALAWAVHLAGAPAWWALPVAALGLLAWSVRREAQRR